MFILLKVNLDKIKIVLFINGMILKNIEKWMKFVTECVAYYKYFGALFSTSLN